MSCLSRLFGLIFALVPGLGLFAFALVPFTRVADLGLPKALLYAFLSVVTGAVCLYLGLAIVFARNRSQLETPALPAPSSATPASFPVEQPLRPAPIPVQPPTQSIFAETPDVQADAQGDAPMEVAPMEVAPMEVAPMEVETPEERIARVASGRTNWRVSAPQLAQLTNLSLGVAEATARSMARNGAGVALATGEQGETLYVFNATDAEN